MLVEVIGSYCSLVKWKVVSATTLTVRSSDASARVEGKVALKLATKMYTHSLTLSFRFSKREVNHGWSQAK